jgi:hypothetical protein
MDRIYHAIVSEAKPAPFFHAGERVPELKFG